jgi:two-component system OmpR family sensor kinase
MKWYWASTLAPLLAGLMIALYLNLFSAYNPIIYVRADLGSVFFMLGFLLTLISAAFMAFWVNNERCRKSKLDLVVSTSEDRRRFLQRLDHELKNPLTAILAGLANLRDNVSYDEQNTVNSIETQAKRLSRLVADLRKLSDLETRKLELSTVNLTELLDEIYHSFCDLPESAQRKLTLSIPHAPWPLPEILADRDLLLLAIHNLLTNAFKFSRPGDTIELRANEEDQLVVIEVADTGPGIPEAEIPHVWEELYRGLAARGIPGSGLGLALVKAIIARHNGQVTLRSRPGKGTVFTIKLPNSAREKTSRL